MVFYYASYMLLPAVYCYAGLLAVVLEYSEERSQQLGRAHECQYQ